MEEIERTRGARITALETDLAAASEARDDAVAKAGAAEEEVKKLAAWREKAYRRMQQVGLIKSGND